MNKAALHSFRTLVRIRIRRQEGLDRQRVAAQHELKRLTQTAEEAQEALAVANDRVSAQVYLIDQLTQSGKPFQIVDYLAQQDYRSSLEEQAKVSDASAQQAAAAVDRQEETVKKARAAATQNTRQRERLEERVQTILTEMEVKRMDDEDEEAEEAVVTRMLMKGKQAAQDAALKSHA